MMLSIQSFNSTTQFLTDKRAKCARLVRIRHDKGSAQATENQGSNSTFRFFKQKFSILTTKTENQKQGRLEVACKATRNQGISQKFPQSFHRKFKVGRCPHVITRQHRNELGCARITGFCLSISDWRRRYQGHGVAPGKS